MAIQDSLLVKTMAYKNMFLATRWIDWEVYATDDLTFSYFIKGKRHILNVLMLSFAVMRGFIPNDALCKPSCFMQHCDVLFCSLK